MDISFIIPAYNEEAVIKPCLESIRAEIARSGRSGEIILVNNASQDRTHEVAASVEGVRVLDESRKGTNRARQTGFEASTGTLIANVDSDSILLSGWLDTVFAEFAANKNLVGLSGPYLYRDITGFTRAVAYFFQFVMYLAYLVNRFVLRTGSQMLGGNCVMTREALTKIGGYNTGLKFYGDDIDTARRLLKVGDVKWMWGLPIISSGRRFKKEGVLKTGWLYMINFFSAMFANKAYSETHADARTEAPNK